MRHILVDFARSQNYAKRGGDALKVSLAEVENVAAERSADLVAMDDALKTLCQLDARQSQVCWTVKALNGLGAIRCRILLSINPLHQSSQGLGAKPAWPA